MDDTGQISIMHEGFFEHYGGGAIRVKRAGLKDSTEPMIMSAEEQALITRWREARDYHT